MRWVVLVMLGHLSVSQHAEACIPPTCSPGAFKPGDGSTIPSSAPALYWRPTRTGDKPSDPSSVRLTAAADPSTPLAFTATALANGDYALVANEPLVEGTSYVLEDLTACELAPPVRAEFTVAASAPLPTTLGRTGAIGRAMRDVLFVRSASLGCTMTTIDASLISIMLTPSEEATPWIALLMFETIVDGELWSHHEFADGPVLDLVYRLCTANPTAANQGLSTGVHQVAFRASLRNGQAITSEPEAIELFCDSLPDPDPDPSPEPNDNDSWFGCAAGGSSSSWLIAGVAAAMLSRRRRRAAGGSSSPHRRAL
ncbi:MAG: hypothetical protein AB7O24_23350 [Kofleriaceae bacterium]